jgi:hypothetical protein
MSIRILGSVLATLALLAPLGRAGADDLESSIPEGKKFLKEGDALADKGEPNEALLRYEKAFEQLLPSMRRLPFHREVKTDVNKREQLRGMLVKEFAEKITPEEMHAEEVALRAFGLIPRGLDLKETMIRMLTEEVAGFYDTKTETMHLIQEDEPKPEQAKKPSFLERLMGKGPKGFDKDENKGLIAHELTHALADQNFDIDKLQERAKGDDDRDLALSALVEGEAFLTMFGAQMEDWNGSKVIELPAERLGRTLKLLTAFMPAGVGPTVKEAPPILSETLIFPYFSGLIFCASLTNKDGWKAIDAAYHEPPLSTEQILHPEKYREKPDRPMAIDLGKLDVPEGWTEVGRNVLGEMQLGILLRKYGGKPAAEGWDGDTFAAFEGPEDRLGIVWLSTWDSEKDAQEFVQSYLRYQTSKLAADTPEPEVFPDSSRRPHQGSLFALERRGMDVAVVEGFPSEPTERLIEACFKAKKTEKTPEQPSGPEHKAEKRKAAD